MCLLVRQIPRAGFLLNTLFLPIQIIVRFLAESFSLPS